mmetsp:Transcript_60909/g.145159  ORF Transcript_60909/g.145159 Transcript_60909/m.145159 type:complete len:236 (+) Transcript_60909:102-809(+)|eukprot:CAMPEP_0178409320 /NCGR_PEP_ID=MMETSP0689_2-20121128/20402_1 /TAXON_ID=160604 /ORGANISM="Amphidinium massartii, Strain CS-259" /LENGTH=235 /DNA_ID=CAMNT_0020030459 /DNA_START=96 /DNA_END=803 /DNA_ORIENTATION=+
MWRQVTLLAFASLLPAAEALGLLRKAGSGSTPSAFRALDTDGSGSVSQAEVVAFARKNGIADKDLLHEFGELDRNGDGMLQMSELEDTVNSDHPHPLPEAKSAETVALERSAVEVQEEASSLIASKFAKMVQTAMAKYHEHEAEAAHYEELAQHLRGNASALVRQVHGEVRDAAKAAAQQTVEEAMRAVHELQNQADMAESQAGELQTQAAQAIDQANAAEQGLNSEVMLELGKA